MPTITDIANMALLHLGSGKTVSDVATERSQEAIALRTFQDMARQATLRDAKWSFARKIDVLGLIEEDPNSEWAYSYRYPTDCLFLRRILSGTRNDSQDSCVPYLLASDAQGKLLFTDMEEAEVEYTKDVTNTGLYPADFVLAFSARWAALVASSLLGQDPFKKGSQAFALYQLELAKAEGNDQNEEQREREPDSEFIRARDG